MGVIDVVRTFVLITDMVGTRNVGEGEGDIVGEVEGHMIQLELDWIKELG